MASGRVTRATKVSGRAICDAPEAKCTTPLTTQNALLSQRSVPFSPSMLRCPSLQLFLVGA